MLNKIHNENNRLNNEQLFSEIMHYLKEGHTITDAIKYVSNNFELGFGSIKTRWYKLIKKEPYLSRYQILTENQRSFSSANNQIFETPTNSEVSSSSTKDELDNESLLALNINQFNNFYHLIKQHPNLMSKLLIVQEHNLEIQKYQEKLDKYEKLYNLAKQIEEVVKKP